MRQTTLSALLLLFILASLNACGGGGGTTVVTPQPTKAVLTLSTSGTLTGGTVIGGIEVEVDLPAGVTTKATTTTANPLIMETDSGVVTASGVASGANLVQGTYTTGAAPNTYKVEVLLASTGGFSTGQFATVNCDIAAGANPATSDFHTANFVAKDLSSGATITGLTVGLTAEFINIVHK
jgi:hypothetical protein